MNRGKYIIHFKFTGSDNTWEKVFSFNGQNDADYQNRKWKAELEAKKFSHDISPYASWFMNLTEILTEEQSSNIYQEGQINGTIN